jgi:hypothetical protein
MKKAKKAEPQKLKDYQGVFVDPENVNSTVRYSLETTLNEDGSTYFEGDLSFGDCTRTITWNGYGDNQHQLLTKIDGALEVLRDARDALVRHIVATDNFKKGIEKPKRKRRG